MTDTPSTPTPPLLSSQNNRRSFLKLLTASSVTVGGVVVAWPFLNSLNSQNTILEHSFVDVDISSLKTGQQITVTWQGHPVFILNRPKETLQTLQDASLVSHLRDPDSKDFQQPPYTQNWHRSIHPETAVLIGVCTHLGCVPTLQLSNKMGGLYNCTCHGSKFDLAGRVYKSMPAPYNLPVPPYTYIKPNIIRIGENPKGQDFDFTKIKQL
ncbi:ubiquinol-cytochrome c reductase iron-sulfur subunit [Commensalibacter papalotli (ex Servin-Garciduenas et al. 2014)]|uniref:Ubiquinol-cytochrome c reductase iron-sulfur subunit n=1 Tax=Commensalibacter papalotli (ex Servin-Garciduenas et al. 2014) TaxID=1208583 RepID=W7DV41_9PROT|nr:ubiquinol-cytochrome c reductase iron-sulfur subunit [Commensalibacter papalotli (ex Servin-Garciduenas et al. 2014)]EUK18108.1 ubiquinol-cytochrome c reductase, iron-sulfur subunit [Commensalibacter papalotli (ex Servin-Garciduenas et al. 2014)]